MDHTLSKVDLDVVKVVAVVVAVVGVEVELSTRKLRHQRESLLSALCLCPPKPALTRQLSRLSWWLHATRDYFSVIRQ
jgi:hypothetical protein